MCEVCCLRFVVSGCLFLLAADVVRCLVFGVCSLWSVVCNVRCLVWCLLYVAVCLLFVCCLLRLCSFVVVRCLSLLLFVVVECRLRLSVAWCYCCCVVCCVVCAVRRCRLLPAVECSFFCVV